MLNALPAPKKVIFLVEEPSMQLFLEALFQQLHLPETAYQIKAFRGKQLLLPAIPRLLNSWREPNTQFFILIDNDNKDCIQLKNKLVFDCLQANRSDTVVRIVCQELEAWYLGDLFAIKSYSPLKKSFKGQLKQIEDNKLIPDEIQRPSKVLEAHLGNLIKSDIAKYMGKNITLEGNSSVSFGSFVQALKTVFPCLPATLETP